MVHFCNLTALSNWFKSAAVSLLAALLALLMSSPVCPCAAPTAMSVLADDNRTLETIFDQGGGGFQVGDVK